MTLCEWQKSTLFPYHWLFSGKTTRNNTYLRQLPLVCITLKDDKSSCSQAVSICRWLSGQFISCPTEDTGSLALVRDCHPSCFNFRICHILLWLTHTFKNALNFPHFLSSCASISFSFSFCHPDLTSSSPCFSFSKTSVFNPCLSLRYIVFFLFPFTVFHPPFLVLLPSFYHYILSLFFLSTQYVNKTFECLNIFCLCSPGFWIIAAVLPKLNYHIKEELSSFGQDFSLSRIF